MKKQERMILNDVWPNELLCLEIETTGLVAKRDAIVMAHLLHPVDGEFVVTGWLGTKKEEKKLLTELLSYLHGQCLVYNENFTKRFLEERLAFHHLPMPQVDWVDGSKEIKTLSPFVTHPSYGKQKLAENILDVDDDFSGRTMAKELKNYEKNPNLEEKLFKMGWEQIQTTIKLYEYAQREKEKLTLACEKGDVTLTGAKIKKDHLLIQAKANVSSQAFAETETIDFHQEGMDITLRIQVHPARLTDELLCLFVDATDTGLVDTTGFHVPNGLLLIEVDGRMIAPTLLQIVGFFMDTNKE